MEMTREQVLRDVSRVFCEFLEVAVHQILFTRNVYPAELFERKRKYNVPVRQSRHKDLNEYVANAVVDVKKWMERGLVEKVVVSIESSQTRQQIERFVFEVDVDLQSGGTNGGRRDRSLRPSNQEELEDALRQVLLKISVAESLLSALPKDITFSIYVHTASSVTQSTDSWEHARAHERLENKTVCARGLPNGRCCGRLFNTARCLGAMTTEAHPERGPVSADSMPIPLIVPLKSIQAADLQVQLYVQSPAART